MMDLQAEMTRMGLAATVEHIHLLTVINKLLQSPAPDDDAAARIEEFISLPLLYVPLRYFSIEIVKDVLDVLDGALRLNYWNPDSDTYRKCLRSLGDICGSTELFPSSCTLPIERWRIEKNQPSDYGGFGLVYKCWLHGAQVVAVKIVLSSATDSYDKRRAAKMRFHKEAVMWRHLRHPNIVPFLGTNRELLGLCTISPWMARDNLKKYLFVMGQKADRPKLVLEIALGLSYLHTRNVTHGDLKSLNVLIDVEHHALLADFGMASVRYNVNSVRQTAPGNGVPRGSVRWMAPELLDPMLGELGKQAWQRLITPIIDVYAFAMVVYEIFSGRIPYYETRWERNLPEKVYEEKKRPDRPENTTDMGLTDAVWDLVTKCWAHEREDRPHMGFVVSQLCDYYNFSVNSDGSISTRVQHGTSFGLIGRQGRYLKKAVPRRALHDYQVERKNTAIRWNMPGPSLADRMRALTLAEEANFPAPVATFYEPSGSRGIGLHTCRRRHHSEYKGIDTAFYLKAGISTLYIDWPTYPIWKKEYDATFFDNGVLTLRELAYDISAQMDMFIHLKLTPNELHEGDATAQDSFRWKLGDDDYDIKLSDIYLIAVDYVGSIIRPIFEFRRKARW